MTKDLSVTFKSVFVLLAERSLMLGSSYILMMIVYGDKVILSEVVSGDAENSSIFVLGCIILECCGKITYKLFRGSASLENQAFGEKAG